MKEKIEELKRIAAELGDGTREERMAVGHIEAAIAYLEVAGDKIDKEEATKVADKGPGKVERVPTDK